MQTPTKTQKHHIPLHLPPLHIYFTIALHFTFIVFYFSFSYIHLVLDNHLVRLRAQNNLQLFCRLLDEEQRGSFSYTQLPESSIFKPSSFPRGEDFHLLHHSPLRVSTVKVQREAPTTTVRKFSSARISISDGSMFFLIS